MIDLGTLKENFQNFGRVLSAAFSRCSQLVFLLFSSGTLLSVKISDPHNAPPNAHMRLPF